MLPDQRGKMTGACPFALLVLLAAVLQALMPLVLHQAEATEISAVSIDPYIENGGYAVQTKQGVIEGLNADTAFIPASTIKLVTCLAALNILGPDYRFQTKLYLDRQNNLIIKGFGDPMLTSEEVAEVAKELAGHGVRQINSVILDTSAFSLEHGVDGSDHSDRPYDAEIGPLAVNFNALPIRVHTDGRVDSGEEQTPALPMMQIIGKMFTPGLYRVNVGAFPAQSNLSNELLYTQELFVAILRQQGIRIRNDQYSGSVPDKASLLLIHTSDTLKSIISDCLEFSNNFIANELFLACGVKRFGFPATWTKAQNALNEFIAHTFRPSPGTLVMVEGSGLSRKNRITPRMMINILKKFSPFADLLPIKHDLLLKSGTLKGVYCYGGYLGDHGRTVPFSIMLNQKTNSRDQILRILEKQFQNSYPNRTAIR